MSRKFTVASLLLPAALACAANAHAQAEQTPENLLDEPLGQSEEVSPPEQEADDAPASRETDFNEDNFRRSMELRDQALQRSPSLTTGSYSSGAGVDVLEDLPESSQKHLRAQLREVIVRNGPWTPEQAGMMYPYAPSEAAQESQRLAQREQEAWSELVANYHEREAAIHANAARTQAATADETGAGSEERNAQAGMRQSPHGDPESESRKHAQSRPQQVKQENSARAARVQGVSQNALELLTSREQLPAGGAGTDSRPDQPQQASMDAQLSEQGDAGAARSPEDGDAAQAGAHEINLDSDDVIAIEDLENVNLESESREGREEDR